MNAAFTQFKSRSLEDRRADYDRIVGKFPDRLPVLIDIGLDAAHFSAPVDPESIRYKYLVPKTMVMSELMATIRKRLPELRPEAAVFLTVGGTIPAMTQAVTTAFQGHEADDGFPTVRLISENTFGGKPVK